MRDHSLLRAREQSFNFFQSKNIFGVKVIVRQARPKFFALSIGKLHRSGILLVDAVPDLFDQGEPLLNVEPVDSEFLH